jgi:hypothetical protein
MTVQIPFTLDHRFLHAVYVLWGYTMCFSRLTASSQSSSKPWEYALASIRTVGQLDWQTVVGIRVCDKNWKLNKVWGSTVRP